MSYTVQQAATLRMDYSELKKDVQGILSELGLIEEATDKISKSSEKLVSLENLKMGYEALSGLKDVAIEYGKALLDAAVAGDKSLAIAKQFKKAWGEAADGLDTNIQRLLRYRADLATSEQIAIRLRDLGFRRGQAEEIVANVSKIATAQGEDQLDVMQKVVETMIGGSTEALELLGLQDKQNEKLETILDVHEAIRKKAGEVTEAEHTTGEAAAEVLIKWEDTKGAINESIAKSPELRELFSQIGGALKVAADNAGIFVNAIKTAISPLTTTRDLINDIVATFGGGSDLQDAVTEAGKSFTGQKQFKEPDISPEDDKLAQGIAKAFEGWDPVKHEKELAEAQAKLEKKWQDFAKTSSGPKIELPGIVLEAPKVMELPGETLVADNEDNLKKKIRDAEGGSKKSKSKTGPEYGPVFGQFLAEQEVKYEDQQEELAYMLKSSKAEAERLRTVTKAEEEAAKASVDRVKATAEAIQQVTWSTRASMEDLTLTLGKPFEFSQKQIADWSAEARSGAKSVDAIKFEMAQFSKESVKSSRALSDAADSVLDFGKDIGQGFGQSVAAAIAESESFGDAMIAIINSTSQKALGMALWEGPVALAQAFMALGRYDYPSATNYFTAAAIWGGIGAAGLIGMAATGGMGGGSGAGASSAASATSYGHAEPMSREEPEPESWVVNIYSKNVLTTDVELGIMAYKGMEAAKQKKKLKAA